MLQIPLIEGTDNTVVTTIEDQTYTFVTKWNDRFSYYSMDIKIDNTDIASGVILNSGVDIASIASIPLNRVYCINKNIANEDFGYTGLGDDGLVIIVEDSDLEE